MTVPERVGNWRKASYSAQGQDCVEVGTGPGVVGVRDTKARQAGALEVPASAWVVFVDALK